MVKLSGGLRLLAAALIFCAACQGASQPPTHIQLPAEGEITYEKPPLEYLAYQAYLDVIRGRPGKAESVLIEGELISLLQSEICPYPEEICPIESYPVDWGQVQVESVQTATGETAEPVVEQGRDDLASGAERATSPNQGKAIPSGKARLALEAGQLYDAIFTVTARPVIVQYAPYVATAAETAPATGPLERGGDNKVGATAMPGHPQAVQPLAKEGAIYVFTIKVGDYPQVVRLSLPGLRVGDRFRAQAMFSDGILYIGEYEKLE